MAAISLLVLYPLVALATDTGVAGQKLVLESRGTAQKLVFIAKDPLVPFPPIGSADDPSIGGAAIELVTSSGTGTLAIAGGLGNPGWRVAAGRVGGYVFKNGAAVRSLRLRQGRVLKITARSVPLAMTTPLGGVGVRITMGSTRTCALFDGPTVVSDVAGSFVARNATAPADCTNASLGDPAVCGDGVIEDPETCEASDDAACPGHCVDCACEPYCGDGAIDPGEVCDGMTFDPFSFACPLQVGPACAADCGSCCATQVCGSATGGYPCCPGSACPIPYGPGAVTSCRNVCTTSSDCGTGASCIQGMCYQQDCTSHDQCGLPGIRFCIVGVCCYVDPHGAGTFCN